MSDASCDAVVTGGGRKGLCLCASNGVGAGSQAVAADYELPKIREPDGRRALRTRDA